MSTERIRRKTLRIGEIIANKNPSISKQIFSVGDVQKLPREVRKIIVEELGNELCSKGLNQNDEPNDYGLEIEDLIDTCDL